MVNCPKCGRKFETKGKLSMHLRWSNFYDKCSPEPKPVQKPPFFCERCGRPFDQGQALGQHNFWTKLFGTCYVPKTLYMPAWLPKWAPPDKDGDKPKED